MAPGAHNDRQATRQIVTLGAVIAVVVIMAGALACVIPEEYWVAAGNRVLFAVILGAALGIVVGLCVGRFYRWRLANLARAEDLLQAMSEGVIAVDGQGRITFFNQGAERIIGWSRDEAQGRGLSEVLNLSESDNTELFEYTSAPGNQLRIHVLTHTDRLATLAVTSARLNIPPGDMEQAVLVLRDITDEEIGRHFHSYFLANITHEFRTPLTGLNASIELLMDEAGYLSPAEMDELLNTIYMSTSGLQALVDNLLESVNIEAGHFAIHRRPTDLNQVLASAIRTMQPLLDRRKQSLSLTEPLRLPAVHADPTRLTQVLINLLSNASKYSPLEETIDLSVTLEDHRLQVAVADRGPGIPPAERARLFRRFVRLGAQATEQVGIGLGLSVVKAIVEGHGGEAGVDERSGGGSVFWFTLPLQEAQE